MSEPNPAVASNSSRRSSVFYAKEKIVSLTHSLKKSRTFDNGTLRATSGTINRKWSKWRQKSYDFSRSPRSPGKTPSGENGNGGQNGNADTTNKFVEFVKETWVTKYPKEPNHWNWKILPQKLKCYDLIPIMVFFAGDNGNAAHAAEQAHALETKNFFQLILRYFTSKEFHKYKVEWETSGRYWCEADHIHDRVKTGTNFVKLLGEMVFYFGNSRAREHLHETRLFIQDKLVDEFRRSCFNNLLELAKLSAFELRHVSRQGFHFIPDKQTFLYRSYDKMKQMIHKLKIG